MSAGREAQSARPNSLDLPLISTVKAAPSHCGARSLIALPLLLAALYVVFSLIDSPNSINFVISDHAAVTTPFNIAFANTTRLQKENGTSEFPAFSSMLPAKGALPVPPVAFNVPPVAPSVPPVAFNVPPVAPSVPQVAFSASSMGASSAWPVTPPAAAFTPPKAKPIPQQPVEKAELRRAVHILLNGNSTFIPFEYLVQPKVCSEGKFAKMVVYTAIPPLANAQRSKLRDYWATNAKQYGFEVVFALGRASGNATNNNMDIQNITAENEQYGDILLANYEDSYKHLIVKYWASLHYHVNYCSHVPFMIHMDADTVLYPENFEHFLSSNVRRYANDLGCQIFTGARVKAPNHIWYVSDDLWPLDSFMQYCHGILILSSLQASARLLDAIPKLGIDYFTAYTIWDVATGPLAKVAGVGMQNLPGLHGSFSLKVACDPGTVAVHNMKDVERIRTMRDFRKDCCQAGTMVCHNRTALPQDQQWIM